MTGTELSQNGSNAGLPRLLEGALSQANPGKTDRELEALLTSLIGSSPRLKERYLYPKTGDVVAVLDGIDWLGMTEEKRSQALKLMDQALAPISPARCFGLLGEMKLLTASKPDQGHDLEAQIKIYERKLSDYPADVVINVLSTHPDRSKWWPTWLELKERLDLLSRRRTKMMASLKNWQPKKALEPA